MSGVTRILERVEQGDPKAAAELLPVVYAELRRLATHLMNGESSGHTLQPTALVHEAWLRLGADAQPQWQNRAHFFGASAEAMRRILVEHARRRRRAKRGGGVEPLDITEVEIASPVFMESFGKPSRFGELWYAEAPAPTGPWGRAVKILSHDNYTFYNPRLHPEFTPTNSPILLFEGTYTQTFADRPPPTPRYDYNQMLYRLDLDDPALLPTQQRAVLVEPLPK